MEFYCTCGRGTEKFTHRELSDLFGQSILAEKMMVSTKLMSSLIEVTDGKVYFSLEPSCARDILQLKSVERIFVKVLHCKSDNLDRRNLVSSVMKLIPDHVAWCRVFATWKSLQDFTIPESPPGKRLKVKENSKQMKFSPCSYNSCPQPIIDEGDKSGIHKIGIADNSKDENTSRCYSDTEILSCDNSDNNNSDNNLQSGVNKLNDKESIDKKLTFRISMKATGNMGKNRNNQMLVKELARKVSQFLDMHVNLRNPDLEICIHLNDNFLTIGIPLTRQPLSKRSYILHHGLRSTVAWIMADLCEIKAGEMVMDPMCGKGSILIEAARTNQTACFLGADINQDQLKFARTNVDFAGTSRNVQIVQADALNLPLPDSFLDCIVMDAPFGIKHTTQLADLKSFYRSLLLEMSRLLKNGGRAVVLTSLELKNFIEKYLSDLHQMDEADFTSETNSITQDTSSNILCFSHCKSKDLNCKCCQEDLPQSRPVSDANNSPTIKAENGNGIERGYLRTASEAAVCHLCTENSKEKCIGSKRHFDKLEEKKNGGQFAELNSKSLLKDAKENRTYNVEHGGHSVDDVSKIREPVHEHDNCSGVSSEIDSADPVHPSEVSSDAYCIEVFHEIHTESVNNAVKVCTLFMKDQHYIKLGEMDSYILELQNRK